MFCREQVAQLRNSPELPVTFVCLALPDEASAFRQEMGSPHRFLCDPGQQLYSEFGLKQGHLGQFVGPMVLVSALRSTARGFRMSKPVGDPKQLGGAFIFGPKLRVLWERRFAHAGSIINVEDMRDAFTDAQGKIMAGGL